jgi:deoxyribodipyrimidine photo-lyase
VKFSKSVFLFRRDFRLADNHGLLNALENSNAVFPLFIFDPRQSSKHAYFSKPGFQFLVESLLDLDDQLNEYGSKLHILEGQPHEVLIKFALDTAAESVYVNRDYTPYSIERDIKIAAALAEQGITFHPVDDALLIPPEHGLKNDGKPYTVFTPFYNRMSASPVAPVRSLPADGGSLASSSTTDDVALVDLLDQSRQSSARGGRRRALAILEKIENFESYERMRNIPSIEGTTRLSAHLKFGTCSVREVYHTLGANFGYDHPLIRQLYWRDFYTHIAFHFPHVFGASFKKQYDRVAWRKNEADFTRWKEGKTGYPIVDAGMRELIATGFMHNRVRMITASFLTKHLLIDWREGERFFAQHLVDYDPSVNNGNWQWSASTGCDAQPYFRIFNPWTQQLKFDPNVVYIKHWVDELRDIPPATIHKIYDHEVPNYPSPIVEHQFARQRALNAFGVLKT